MTTTGSGVVRIRGHEFLGTVHTPASGTTICGVFDLNPACWAGSRLARIASTYEKYRYDMIKIRFHSASSTSSAGSISMYLEFEANEIIGTNHLQSLNHQYSALGPRWAPMEITYHRPKEDPTVYYMTSNAQGSGREDLTQAKAVFVSGDDSSAVFGFASIEYDVTFLYPEIETGYAGEQYEWSQATYPSVVAESVIETTPAWSSGGVKVAELVLDQNMPTVFVNALNNQFNFLAGAVIYTAWDGYNWLLYNTVEAAATLAEPLKWVAGTASGILRYRVRRLLRV